MTIIVESFGPTAATMGGGLLCKYSNWICFKESN